MAVLPAIEALSRETDTASCAATHSSTAPVLGYVNEKSGLKEKAIPFNTSVLEYVRSARISKVVLVARWTPYFNDSTAFPDALLNTVTTLQDAGATVYFMCDVPIFDFNVPRALALYSLNGGDLSELGMIPDDYACQNQQLHESVLPRLRNAGVHILDPSPALQARTSSSRLVPFDSGGSFYYDEQHLSTYGALAIKSVFLPVFE